MSDERHQDKVALALSATFYERFESQARKNRKQVLDEVRQAIFWRRVLENARDDSESPPIEVKGEVITSDQAGKVLLLCDAEYLSMIDSVTGNKVPVEEQVCLMVPIPPIKLEELQVRAIYNNYPSVAHYIIGAMIVSLDESN